MNLLRTIFGRKQQAPVQIPSTEVVAAAHLSLATAFQVKTEREERPRFRRSYERQLDARASIKLVAHSMSFGRCWSGELSQPGGRWVFFDPNRVADKILDPALVPLVEAACDEAMQLDRDFVRSKPAEFVDDGGTTWRRLA